MNNPANVAAGRRSAAGSARPPSGTKELCSLVLAPEANGAKTEAGRLNAANTDGPGTRPPQTTFSSKGRRLVHRCAREPGTHCVRPGGGGGGGGGRGRTDPARVARRTPSACLNLPSRDPIRTGGATTCASFAAPLELPRYTWSIVAGLAPRGNMFAPVRAVAPSCELAIVCDMQALYEVQYCCAQSCNNCWRTPR